MPLIDLPLQFDSRAKTESNRQSIFYRGIRRQTNWIRMKSKLPAVWLNAEFRIKREKDKWLMPLSVSERKLLMKLKLKPAEVWFQKLWLAWMIVAANLNSGQFALSICRKKDKKAVLTISWFAQFINAVCLYSFHSVSRAKTETELELIKPQMNGESI